MGDPCSQEAKIAELLADRKSLNRTLEKLEYGQSEFIVVLRDISAQAEQIKSLVQRLDKTEKDVDSLYKRMRDAEMSPGRSATIVQQSVITIIIAAVVAFFARKIGG